MRTVSILLFLSLLISCGAEKNNSDPANEKEVKGSPVDTILPDYKILGFFRGELEDISKYDLSKMTHLAFGFTRLKGNKMVLEKPDFEIILQELVNSKKIHPELKILISFGGWGGCETCSDVFNTETGRKEFAASVKEFIDKYELDGIDIDWESPVIGGFKDHPALPEDKENFTLLIKGLRHVLGNDKIICFDANSFREFLIASVNWKEVMPLVDWVNLMTYTLPENHRQCTNHHTAIYSSKDQTETVDYAVRYLDSIGVPLDKILLGAAFYGMQCENVESTNNGLYQKGKLKSQPTYAKIVSDYLQNPDYAYHWDSVTMAPYLYSAKEKMFITFDDTLSVKLKVGYAFHKGLGGIMYWKINGDIEKKGLMDAIYSEYEKKYSLTRGKR